MSRHRVRRFVLEVLFLAAVAAVVTAGDLRPAAVVVVMALAWIVVALFEWASWLDEPHYGRGLPPRYYVPQVALPPPRPVEQPGARRPHPRSRDEAPTRIGSPAQWTTGVEDWPLLVPDAAGEDTEIALPGDLPPEPLPEFPPEIEPALMPEPAVDEPEAAGAEVATEPEAEPPAEEPAVPVEDTGVFAPGTDADAGSLPLPEPAVSRSMTARHHVDPLAGRKRRGWLRRSAEEGATVEVPDGPPAGRPLPSRTPAGRRGNP